MHGVIFQVLNSPTWHSQADVTVASKTVAEKVSNVGIKSCRVNLHDTVDCSTSLLYVW